MQKDGIEGENSTQEERQRRLTDYPIYKASVTLCIKHMIINSIKVNKGNIIVILILQK